MRKLILGCFIGVFSIVGISGLCQESLFVPGELMVMVQEGYNPSNVVSYLNGVVSEVQMEKELSKTANVHLIQFDESILSSDVVLELLRSNSHVIAAQRNHYINERATVPNDPLYGLQRHHSNVLDHDIDSDLAWDVTTGGQTANGHDIVVCVLEGGGADYNHVDLIQNHWVNQGEIPGNGVDDDGNGYVDDYNGWNTVAGNDVIAAGSHGTSVSGMIGAKGNNGNGGTGVNWDVKIMQVQMGPLTESEVIAAYDYPLTLRTAWNNSSGGSGAFVVATNASWGIDAADPANFPVWCAFYDTLGAAGILNCAATTNQNVNVDGVGDMPTGCSSPYLVAVTATNSSDVRTSSGCGFLSIDLAAPGKRVLLPDVGDGYTTTSGTSFANPCVAGAIALLYSTPCSG